MCGGVAGIPAMTAVAAQVDPNINFFDKGVLMSAGWVGDRICCFMSPPLLLCVWYSLFDRIRISFAARIWPILRKAR